MLAGFGAVALFLIVATLFAAFSILLPVILRLLKIVPKKPDPVKDDTYECGMETQGRSWVQFNFRYYFYALLLIALDVLAIFLYPWAAGFRELGVFGFMAIFFFILLVVVGYIHAWKKGVLEWK